MNKKKILVGTLGALFLPFVVFAANIASMAAAVAEQAVIVGDYIVIIMWVVDGIMFLMAAGDPGKLGAAKTGLFACVAGTIIILLANGAEGFVRSSFGI